MPLSLCLLNKGMLRKILLTFTVFLFFFFTFSNSASASNSDSENGLPKEYYDAIESLPPEISDNLPADIYSESSEKVAEGLSKMLSADYFVNMLGNIVSLEISSSVALLGKLCGVILISAIFATLKSSISSEALSRAFGFCSTCTLFGVIAQTFILQIELLASFFERLNSLMVSFVPIACTVWAIGGNVGTAAASGGILYAFLGVSEVLCAKTAIPVSVICLVFALCRGIAPSLNLSGFSSAIRKCYTFTLGFIMTLLLAILSSQTILSSSKDSIGARSAKIITATVIPVVGGSVSETLRTLGASVQYIKSIVGVSAILFIIVLLLPTLITLIITRLVYLLAGSVADLLGCERESRLIGELGGISGVMIATASMVSVMFILAFNIFIKTSVAMVGV